MRKKIREEKNVGSPDVETRTVGIELIIFHIFIGAFYTIPFGGFLTYVQPQRLSCVYMVAHYGDVVAHYGDVVAYW